MGEACDIAPLISVRGEAWSEVAPDVAALSAGVRLFAPSVPDALRVAAQRTAALAAAMTALGGERLRAGARPGLGWAAHAASTWAETEWVERTGAGGSAGSGGPAGSAGSAGSEGPTGRIGAAVQVRIVLRDLELLDRLGMALSGIDDLHVEHVSWQVDADNPAWARLRAEAVRAALDKGRDYAAALGGDLLAVEQLADVGLLAAGGDGAGGDGTRWSTAGFASYSAAEAAVPSLDPVPQRLSATVEARLSAAVPALR